MNLLTRPRPSVAGGLRVPRLRRSGTAPQREPRSRSHPVEPAAASTSCLFGLEVAGATMAEVLERASRCVETRERLMLGVLNAAKIVNLQRDEVLRDSLLECDLLLADGQSVVWASRLLRPSAARAGGRHRPLRARCSTEARPARPPRVPAGGHARRCSTPFCASLHERWPEPGGGGQPQRLLRGRASRARWPSRSPGQPGRPAVPRHVLAEEGDLPRSVRRPARRTRHARRGRLVRRAGRGDPSCPAASGSAPEWSGPTGWCRSRDGCGGATSSPTPRSCG